jgi:hypothetical protein
MSSCARKADVELEADVLLIVGNAHVGTPLMRADPASASSCRCEC